MDNATALDPQNSVVVEACAGSGKTWLLVSRIVRLLLADVQPSEILAITFTRKAAQEMQARLRDWLYDLATKDDDFVRQFLLERAIDEQDLDAMLPRARGLYQQFLLAQPPLTINTFHGWFMQIVQRAPLDAGMAGGVQLVEQTGALWDEASTLFFAGLHRQPDSETALSMNVLFVELGLFNTQKMLRAFADKRSEWWAYTAGQENPLNYALEQLREEFQVDLDADVIAEYCADAEVTIALQAFAQQLASNGTEAQCNNANKLIIATEIEHDASRFAALREFFCTKADEPRKTFKPTKKQDEASYCAARDAAQASLQAVLAALQAQAIYRFNDHALRCGVAMLDRYQQLKQQQQSLDFSDLEWRVCQLLNNSAHAEYLQYKLDSRYKHVLLDEFQDTNPLQWQILQAWFDAAAAVQSTPKIFVVGDPKQSIYRFRRADARLFNVVCEYLRENYHAKYLQKNTTRRNAPAVLNVVNAVFDGLQDGQPKFAGFETHQAHQTALPGYVEVLPLSLAADSSSAPVESEILTLRNPLTDAYPDREQGARELEAQAFATKLLSMVGSWQVHADGQARLPLPNPPPQEGEGANESLRDCADAGGVRALQWGDIMVLVRRRTHLKTYEQALRAQHIPYLTSRRGGLLDTLEASDIQALLTFLMTPFADLQLAHVLRSPIFSCSDAELMRIQEEMGSDSISLRATNSAPTPATQKEFESAPISSNWWQRLQSLIESGDASAHLQRAHNLLQSWLVLAEKLPVHDLLDKIYFDADVQSRYAAAVPTAMRATVLANLQAFIEIALNVDAGRYPSLSRFLRTLDELKQAADNEAPNEGAVDKAGDALRIYTVHESKGLEAPLVWLLDSNAKAPSDKGFDVLLDWPTNDTKPAHLSLYTDQASHGAAREKYFAAEKILADREDMNLLYVAMTRAKQVLMVSGSGKLIADTWYERVANAHVEMGLDSNSLLATDSAALSRTQKEIESDPIYFDARLTQAVPTGTRQPVMSEPQRRGIWLHGLLQYLATSKKMGSDSNSLLATDSAALSRTQKEIESDPIFLQRRLNIPDDAIDALWQQAQHLLTAPHLARFFDAQQYRSASNEMPYVNAQGELKRIDRLVEFDDEVWVLDYKLGDSENASRHHAQMREYQTAMQSVYAEKKVRCALLFADGKFSEI
ncbi:MAG: UvrD-helicase domain-containing protein [Sideroxydans sp.]|nr:UvrD-helicase domain-containing protein [Sideroxydans sp.]